MLNEMNRLRGRRVHKASVRNAEASRQEGIRDGAMERRSTSYEGGHLAVPQAHEDECRRWRRLLSI